MLFHNKKWERKTLAQMKTPRISFAACFLGEDRQKVVVAGGYTQKRKALDLCELFDVHKNEWRDLPQMNSARVSSSIVNCPNSAGDDNLFVIGGSDENGALLDTIENLEPGSEDWITLSFTLPGGGIQSLGAFSISAGEILVFGGWAKGNRIPHSYIYNVEEDSIEKGSDLPQADLFTVTDFHINSVGAQKLFALGSQALFSFDVKKRSWSSEFDL